MAVTYNGTTYYYVTNLQGDVIAILDSAGTAVVQYSYNAWGKLLSDEPAANSIGNLNPLRYRGYVYDEETNLYYLQSRYYDPELGRFINADALVSTGQGLLDHNMFAYCGNNPVAGCDPNGMWNQGGFLLGISIAAFGVLATAAILMSAGAATPVVAAAITTVGTAIGTTITATGAVTAYGAATEQTVVYDVSAVDGSTHDKHGFSVVIDFDTSSATVETYYHYGKTTSGYGASYGTGVVNNYEKPGDYGGYFVDGGGTYSFNGVEYGVDICTDPSAPFNKCSAALFTVGVSFPSRRCGKFGAYGGVDYYQPISYSEW